MVTLGVEMAVGCWNGRGAIRLSAQVYNRPSDYERMAVGVRDYLGGSKAGLCQW
jgi:isopenicillin-N epimerase